MELAAAEELSVGAVVEACVVEALGKIRYLDLTGRKAWWIAKVMVAVVPTLVPALEVEVDSEPEIGRVIGDAVLEAGSGVGPGVDVWLGRNFGRMYVRR